MAEQAARRYVRQVGRWRFDSARGHDGPGCAEAHTSPGPSPYNGKAGMRNKITAVLAFALVLFAPTFVPSPAQGWIELY